MNDLNRLAEAIRTEFPGVQVGFETPRGAQQPAWADLEYEGRSVVVEWRPGAGFGVSLLGDLANDPSEGLFAGPDRVFQTWQEARSHIAHLFALDDQPRLRRFAG